MIVALSDMSRDALIRELRVAQAFPCGNSERIRKIKFLLAKRKPRDKVAEQVAGNYWWNSERNC